MSQKSPPPQSNKIRIAFDRAEAVTWRGRGIVIDLFRFSNTICALLESGRRDVKEFGNDGWTIVTKDHSLSAQWEHTVLVTPTGYEVLTLSAGSPPPPAFVPAVKT